MAKVKSIKLPRSIREMFPNVTSAVDAAKAVEVSVSKKDCADAKRLNPTECALARAARRELHVDGVIIGMSSSYVIRGNTAVRYHTPESVQREIVSFDRHQDFAPGDYYLLPKSPATRFENMREREKGRKGGKDKTAKRKVHMSARVRVLPKGQ
jgi:hypothetical protein